ncbi:MAG TPA: YceI family protein [Vicinamibacteria bacterium]|jgi:polyisoprenoid-binding protein YceI
MQRQFLAVAALVLGGAPAFAADVYAIDKNHSEVGFQIRHFVTKVRGRFTDFQGTIVADRDKPESSSVEFSVKTASIDTDVVNRDNDLRSANFFEAEKYPDITFKSTKVKSTGKDTYDVTGNFTMHGVTREITLPVTYLGAVKTKDPKGNEGEKVGFETAVTLNRKDYGIIWNRPLDQGGLMLGDDVLITINIEANKQPPPKPAAN